MGIPSFNILIFRAQYPMYDSIAEDILVELWKEADVFGTPIISNQDEEVQEHFYYVVEAHLAELWLRGPGASGIVTEGEQGTVQGSFFVDQSSELVWWNQTSWGAKIVTLMRRYGGFQFVWGGNPYYAC